MIKPDPRERNELEAAAREGSMAKQLAHRAWWDINDEEARAAFRENLNPDGREYFDQVPVIPCWFCMQRCSKRTPPRASVIWMPLAPQYQSVLDPAAPAMPACEEHYSGTMTNMLLGMPVETRQKRANQQHLDGPEAKDQDAPPAIPRPAPKNPNHRLSTRLTGRVMAPWADNAGGLLIYAL